MPSITQDWKCAAPAPGWRSILAPEFARDSMKALIRFLDEERQRYLLHPDAANIFRAFSLTDFEETKVVILGQDPYPTPGHANGLAFSVNDGVALPRSLQNIYREIEQDCGVRCPQSGNLDRWARQGVFLLNTSLTVRSGAPNSHQGRGWEPFTSAAVAALARRETPTVFMLWGRNAQEKESLIDRGRHLILKAAHPSPMSADRGFFGCRHFSKANDFLRQHGRGEIAW